ncbi:MAG TPA: hypothetical protein VJZ71_10175 [Phycisphaerae bacterium]|nr:hypothetical protein [Phycisphaerae bacterium]
MTTNNNSKFLLISGVLVVALGAGAWGLTAVLSEPPPSETQLLLAEAREDPNKLIEKMRDESLTEEQREKLRQNMREVFESRMDEAVNEYYAAKPEDREAIINRHIDEMEKWRKAREDREREEQEKARSSGKSDEEIEKEREKEREERRKNRENRSREERKSDSETRSPDSRARRMAYRDAMRKQMQARGIEPPRWGPGGGGGGPGGGPGRG